MIFGSKFIAAATLYVAVVAAARGNGKGNNNNQNQNQNQVQNQAQGQGQNNANNANNANCLQANEIQSASNLDGSPKAGQAASETDANNFIHVCDGKTLQNGKQFRTGKVCNPTPMGDLCEFSNCPSVMFKNPQQFDFIKEKVSFDLQVNFKGLNAGSFTNPDTTYYSAPLKTDGNGVFIGHVHITCQDLNDDIKSTSVLDQTTFAFFKGINDAGNGGVLSATVTGGLPSGAFRCCTITSGSNHQSVQMPVAQRGFNEDCVRFTVNAAGADPGNAAGNNAGGKTAGSGKNNGKAVVNKSASATDAASSAADTAAASATDTAAASATDTVAAAAATNAAAAGGRKHRGQNKKNRNRHRNRGQSWYEKRFAARDFIA